MSRDAAYHVLEFTTAAASAGTTFAYIPLLAPFVIEGFMWSYGAQTGIGQATGLTSEANVDNTIKLAIATATDGSTFTNFVGNFANAAGHLDSGAPGVVFRNPSNPASGGAAFGAEAKITALRCVAKTLVRVQFITAGTGTIPPEMVSVYGKYLATDGVT